ncbi:DUF2293 domain-containing protein [Saccharicrinis fermentans]|uniref:DUF2293 domain-containing protein n=1 Tax=Saccharicrinis fermentans DSM 9555 = JCM 21142 TaxID=869213 RepID=W7Y6E9_9BACT|nr:DUF2293 domain-containing protein [Saccharicrinis fermentans]GAF03198.1 hypothetical protein JCM21142_41863 [Saccharicrinis fermentans DSM 9555 = JCM 21142]
MKQSGKTVTTDQYGNLKDEEGYPLTPPKHWRFLPAGDAGITRKVTARGEFWRVIFKKGRRTMSKGVWAPSHIISSAQKEMESIRSTDEYQKKKIYNAQRREKQQIAYEEEFSHEVEKFLNFHPLYHSIAKALAILVTQHAIPVGSGTVARTQMIPISERASRAVIAWMRHQTTAYDHMNIARIKGERRTVRRTLAQQSVKILENYRKGLAISPHCPLKSALEKNIQKKRIQ